MGILFDSPEESSRLFFVLNSPVKCSEINMLFITIVGIVSSTHLAIAPWGKLIMPVIHDSSTLSLSVWNRSLSNDDHTILKSIKRATVLGGKHEKRQVSLIGGVYVEECNLLPSFFLLTPPLQY